MSLVRWIALGTIALLLAFAIVGELVTDPVVNTDAPRAASGMTGVAAMATRPPRVVTWSPT